MEDKNKNDEKKELDLEQLDKVTGGSLDNAETQGTDDIDPETAGKF